MATGGVVSETLLASAADVEGEKDMVADME
jgi:hypothetical protein